MKRCYNSVFQSDRFKLLLCHCAHQQDTKITMNNNGIIALTMATILMLFGCEPKEDITAKIKNTIRLSVEGWLAEDDPHTWTLDDVKIIKIDTLTAKKIARIKKEKSKLWAETGKAEAIAEFEKWKAIDPNSLDSIQFRYWYVEAQVRVVSADMSERTLPFGRFVNKRFRIIDRWQMLELE